MSDNPLPCPDPDEALNDKDPVKDDKHPPVERQIKRQQKKDGAIPGHYGADADLAARVTQLEAAVTAIATVELGDTERDIPSVGTSTPAGLLDKADGRG